MTAHHSLTFPAVVAWSPVPLRVQVLLTKSLQTLLLARWVVSFHCNLLVGSSSFYVCCIPVKPFWVGDTRCPPSSCDEASGHPLAYAGVPRDWLRPGVCLECAQRSGAKFIVSERTKFERQQGATKEETRWAVCTARDWAPIP